MDVVNCFSLLQLQLLGDEWTQQVWDSDFMEIEEFPNEYEEFLMENDVLNVLETIVNLIRVSIEQNSEESDTSTDPNVRSMSWELLVENKVEHRHLLPLLAYLIENGQNKPDDMKSLELCFKASSLYFLILAIPGCEAFFVFQPSIYEKALKIFSVGGKLNETKSNRQSKGRKRITGDDGQDDDGDNEDGNDASFLNLSAQAKVHIRKSLNIVIKDLLFMMKRYPLKVEDTLEKTITQLISHTRLANSVSSSDFDVVKVNGDGSTFVSNSFTLLKSLCIPLHGKREETVRLILYHLLPNILMAGDFIKDMTMHSLNMIRLQTERFVLYLLRYLNKDAYEGICVFVQHLCARVTDKADYRLKVSQSIVSILNALPSEPYFLTIKWLLRFAHDGKASHRLFALEVISKILYEEERPNDLFERRDSLASQPSVSPGPQENISDDEREESHGVPLNNTVDTVLPERDVASHKYLLGVLFSRCHDQSGTVRTKALSTLTDCLRSNNKLIVELMTEIFVIPYENNDVIENDNIVERGFLNTKIFLDSLDKPQHLQAHPLPGGKAVVNEILNLVKDDKVFVRKSAFTLLECIMRLNHKWLTEKLLKVMCDHVRDPALLIRKQLIQSLTDLILLYPEDARLATNYIDAVLPQISHPELKVQEKVLDAFQSTILQRLVPYEKLNSPLSYLPWKLLEVIVDVKKRKFFQIVCSMWSKNNIFQKNLISLIQSHIDTQHNVAAWLFLSCVAAYVPIKNPHFIVEYYRENLMNPEKAVRCAVVKSLDALGTAWKYLPPDEQDSVCTELLESVQNTRLSTTLIGPVLDVVHLITFGKASTANEGQKAVMTWAKKILEKLEEYFQQHSPCKSDNTKVNMEEFMRNLVTLGDVAQLCPGIVPVHLAIVLTGIIFPEKLHDPARWSHPGIQALTVVTLGKMCLQNECLAKRIIPALGLLLADSKHEAVKINVMNTLSDMCIRFTAVVEPLLPEMCVCLKDSNIAVRHHTISVFVRLLQQDFLKLRGGLLFHMMSMLVDPVPSIAQLANYFMTQCVVTRNKNIMYQNIVESIFYYNKYETHPVYSKVKLSNQEAHLFNMAGSENELKRQTLYRFMCEHMTDEQRMQSVHKICVDILGGVSSDIVALDEKGESVLRDAFFVLSCEEICLHSLRTQSDDEPATDDVERVTAAVNTAKKNIISQCVKKQVVEIIIPIIMQLKGKLQAAMSPLLTYLMGYLRNILKDYKNEIEDIFAEDKTLAEEILFDIKRFEEEEKRRSQSHDSEEEDDEVDHMRPILVELATNHLCRTIEEQSGPQSRGIGSPENHGQPSTASPEGRKSNNKSPSSASGNENHESPLGESNQLDDGKVSEENSQAKQQSTSRTRRNSSTESGQRAVRARSRTPTRARSRTPTRARSRTPTRRPSSRNSQKRTIDDVEDSNSMQTDSKNKSLSSTDVPQRRSSRTSSIDSNSPCHNNIPVSMETSGPVNRTENLSGPSSQNEKRKGKRTTPERNVEEMMSRRSSSRNRELVNNRLNNRTSILSSGECDTSSEEEEGRGSVVQECSRSGTLNRMNEGNVKAVNTDKMPLDKGVKRDCRGDESSRKRRQSFELFL